MRFYQTVVILGLVALLLPSSAYANECPGKHCSKKSKQINAICIKQGRKGEPVWVEHKGDFCYCVCSCVASNTLVETADDNWTSIGELKVGDPVLAMSADGTWQSKPVVFSDGTKNPEEPYPYAIYVALKDGPAIISTADHLFLTLGGLKRADRLSPSDQILNKDREPLEIESLTNGAYHGGIHNIVAGEFPEDPDAVEIDGHLINTAGVISGDYFLQLYYEQPNSGIAATPQVGSPEFEAAFSNRASALKEGLKNVIELGKGVQFIPAHKFVPPKGACSFLPPGQDQAKAGVLANLDDSISLAMARYLVSHFRTYYPDITYHIEWNDNSVNAYAWQEADGTKHVALLGGLLRHSAIRLEGAGLVLAHEIGHHYGGKPRYPDHSWLSSCEGQADYWGALVAMRQVWFGAESMRQIKEGAVQLYDLFAHGLTAGNLFEIEHDSTLAGLCSHPPAQCRMDTYHAAMRLEDKPACAGDPPGIVSLTPNRDETPAVRISRARQQLVKQAQDGARQPTAIPTLAVEQGKDSKKISTRLPNKGKLEEGIHSVLKVSSINH